MLAALHQTTNAREVPGWGETCAETSAETFAETRARATNRLGEVVEPTKIRYHVLRYVVSVLLVTFVQIIQVLVNIY